MRRGYRNVHNLLNALESYGVKPRGKNKWVSRCPCHDEKTPSLNIKLTDQNSVLAYCFGCSASGLDVYRTLGLSLDELFGKPLEKDDRFVPREIREKYIQDKIVIAIVDETPGGRDSLSLYDKRRHSLALSRIEGVKRKFPNIEHADFQ